MARPPKVPSYSLHKPSGRAVVKVKGRSIYLGKYGSDESRDAYARIVADLLAGRPIEKPDTNRGNPTPKPSLTIGELVARFQRHADGYYRKGGKPTTEPAAIRCALKFLTDHHVGLPAADFSLGDLKVIRQAMVDAGHTRGTINKNIRRVRLAFTWAATEELLPPSVPQNLALLPGLKAGRTVAKETEPVKPVDITVVDKTLPHMPDIVADMVRLQLLTGCRPDEVCSIRPQDIDRTGEVWEYHVDGHKTEHHGKRRTVFIGPEGQKILTPYLLRPSDEFCFRPKRHIAVPKKQKRYRVDSYRQAIQRACARAFPAPKGTEGKALDEWNRRHRWAPNQVRHTAATSIRQRFGLEAAQVILGHSKADVTQVYAERDITKGREVAALIG
ncbi:site-specific integrase [Aeoliella sp. ICT_H6.2]|uniref:Site-specific integrase n=1 Tax=Aeoliella straminimaris TaxID=2954799 RepID=A0A9X2FAI7_9BACT|nr:site-specific integrase [Aeoliella straminimaris]MCO6044633.1 site-specific integrase [Aeoliella straminimaris]